MSENVNEQISKTRMMICKKAERKGKECTKYVRTIRKDTEQRKYEQSL